MKKLYLIRHAHTVDNDLKRYSGFSDTDLSETGKEQSKQLCEYLKENVRVDKVYTSFLKRTYETVRPYLEWSSLPVVKKEGLNEMNFGKFDSLTLKEIEEKYPIEYKEFMKGDVMYRFPEGENLEETYNRNIKAFEEIMNENDGDESVMIVGHMGTVRNIISYLCMGNYNMHWSIKVENASVIEIEFMGEFPIIQFGYIPYEKSLLRPHKIKKFRQVKRK